MERFLQRGTLKLLSFLTKITWGSLRGELVLQTLRLHLEYNKEGTFYA